MKVHWAETAEQANEIIHGILRARNAKKIVKAKTMVSEETKLVPYLEERGVECVETDLGEFIIQIDGDHPSHIVKPIIHKNRGEIATSFEKHGLGAYNDDPQTITLRARAHLRRKYLEADAAITGANFVTAESGRLVLVTNEGNSRFCLAATKTHIAMVGIEKLLPATATSRSSSISSPARAPASSSRFTPSLSAAPRPRHSPTAPRKCTSSSSTTAAPMSSTPTAAKSPLHPLRRVPECLPRLPPGQRPRLPQRLPRPRRRRPLPLLAGKKFPELADLPKASTLCGACNEVCPVDIPIPDLLVKLRAKGKGTPSPPLRLPPLAPSQPSPLTPSPGAPPSPQAASSISRR